MSQSNPHHDFVIEGDLTIGYERRACGCGCGQRPWFLVLLHEPSFTAMGYSGREVHGWIEELELTAEVAEAPWLLVTPAFDSTGVVVGLRFRAGDGPPVTGPAVPVLDRETLFQLFNSERRALGLTPVHPTARMITGPLRGNSNRDGARSRRRVDRRQREVRSRKRRRR